jgi:hypothetical protein
MELEIEPQENYPGRLRTLKNALSSLYIFNLKKQLGHCRSNQQRGQV